jgi:predicted nuclease of predicted toxin-antitoxin system
MKFLANENFPLASVRRLRDAHYDVASVTEDAPGITDHEVLTRAQQEGRIVVTFDRDYGELLYRKGFSATMGIVYFRLRTCRDAFTFTEGGRNRVDGKVYSCGKDRN